METDLSKCEQCRKQQPLGFDFTMAFQPIVNVKSQSIFGYEALVRGINDEGAGVILSQVTDENRYRFDQLCRTKAIALAAELSLSGMLGINFLPNAVYQPERCIRTTLEAAKRYDFPTDRIMFEFTEVEKIDDASHVRNIVDYYKNLGFVTALDDFGAGYSGLSLLADFQTNIVKLDMNLIRNIDTHEARQAIMEGVLVIMRELKIQVLAEGVETLSEYRWLQQNGIELMQGYLFARPEKEYLPDVDFSVLGK